MSLPAVGMREPGLIVPPLIFVPGESLVFYINYAVSGGVTITDGSGNSFSAGSVAALAVTGGSHGIYSVTVPSAPDGVYALTVGGMTSNFVEIVNDVAYANQISAIVSYNHKKILHTFFYPYSGEGFRQIIRLRLSVIDQQPETNIEGYEETNTGKQRNLQGISKQYVTFRTPDYQLEDHSAAHLMTLHDSILINGKEYIRRPAGVYKASISMDTPVSSGEFSLYEQSSQFLLKC